MDAKVLRRFRDAENPSRIYGVGETFAGTDERVAGLVSKGFVEALSADETPEEPKDAPEAAKEAPKPEKAPEKSKKRKTKKKTEKE